MLKTRIVINDESKALRLKVSIERVIDESDIILQGEKIKNLERYINVPVDGNPVNIIFIKGNKIIKVPQSVSLELNKQLIRIKLKVWENNV